MNVSRRALVRYDEVVLLCYRAAPFLFAIAVRFRGAFIPPGRMKGLAVLRRPAAIFIKRFKSKPGRDFSSALSRALSPLNRPNNSPRFILSFLRQ